MTTVRNNALVFRQECVGAHHGQVDMRLLAVAEDTVVGCIEYVQYNDEVSIQMIEVSEDQRRMGVGTELAIELQRAYPDVAIDWGGLTDDGAAWFRSLPLRYELDLEMLSICVERNEIEANLATYESLMENLRLRQDEVSQTEREAIYAQVSDWNELSDRLEHIDRAMHERKLYRTMVETGEGCRNDPANALGAALGWGDTVLRPDGASEAKMWQDQFAKGELGHAESDELIWFETKEYPITRIKGAPDAKWFEDERQMWADEGEPDRFDDMIDEPIYDPVVIHDNGASGWLWDGNHRTGAAVFKGEGAVPALVGLSPEVVLQCLSNSLNNDQIEGGVRSADLVGELVEVDGVMRPTMNSRGLLIHPSREGIENFWKWFGDSKTVDEQGRPLVVFHGSITWERDDLRFGDIESFDRRASVDIVGRPEGSDAIGTWFSSEPDERGASLYAGPNGVVYPVYIKLENPWEIESFNHLGEAWRDWQEHPGNSSRGRTLYASHPWRGDADWFVEGMRMDECDGIIMAPHSGKDSGTEFSDQWCFIVVDAKNIKSAIGNSGRFDPDSSLLADQEPSLDCRLDERATSGPKF